MTKKPEDFTSYPSCQVSYIYGLVCPENNIVRYVGKSVSPLTRFRQHMFRLKEGEGQYKVNWIKSLKDKGLRPQLTLIGCFDINQIDEKETYYITYYKNWLEEKGYEKGLTNLDFGLYSVSENTRRAVKESRKQKNSSIGVKKKRNLWEVYISINNERFYCGNFTNKVVAQKVYDAVSRNYFENPVVNFENIRLNYKLTVEQAQQLSVKFSRRRNGWGGYLGIGPIKNKNKWNVKIKIDNKWILLGRTDNLEKGIEIRDRVALNYGIDLLKEEHKSLDPIDELTAKQLLSGKKSKYIGVTTTKYGFNVYFTLPGENKSHYICSTKDEKEAAIIYDKLANYYNKKKSNHTTNDKLTLEEAKNLNAVFRNPS
jgi:hypothetical protein